MERIPILKMGRFLLVTIQVDMHDQLAMTLQEDLTNRIVSDHANGVLLEGISEESGAAIGADVGSGYEGPRGTIDVGVGASTLMLQRYGRGIAIYLPDR